MRRKSGFTIVEQAIALVPDFKKVTKRMEEQVVQRGQSISTLSNYIRRTAAFVVHFGKLPEQIEPDEIALPVSIHAAIRSARRGAWLPLCHCHGYVLLGA